MILNQTDYGSLVDGTIHHCSEKKGKKFYEVGRFEKPCQSLSGLERKRYFFYMFALCSEDWFCVPGKKFKDP